METAEIECRNDAGLGLPSSPSKTEENFARRLQKREWLLALGVFSLSCMIWSRIVTGTFWSFDIDVVTRHQYLGLSQVTGVSIFEYPSQIVVLGLLMGIMTVVPILVAQLIGLRRSFVFLLVVFFLTNLFGLAIVLLLSCLAVSSRSFRSRSKIMSLALAVTPQLVYWGLFGSARGTAPLQWALSFAPWLCAWITALGLAGLVLSIGHFYRHKARPIWILTLTTLLLVVGLFEWKIGFDELDYQLYVAKNDPENVEEFHDHSITDALDATITDPAVVKYLGETLFYVTEPIPLRAELKKEIQIQLQYDRWPGWFIMPKTLDYQEKREWLLHAYDFFIRRWPNSKRIPIALYFKALLNEYRPDVRFLGEKEILRFYRDYPHRESLATWHCLYGDFSKSSESIEARWRIAMDWAGQGRFEQADKLLSEALDMVDVRTEQLAQEKPSEVLLGLFHPPADSVITTFKLTELQWRLNQLRLLIGLENRTVEDEAKRRLAELVTLNPHSLDYTQQLGHLLEKTSDKDQLRDNILLAQAKLEADDQLRAERLKEVHESFSLTDGGMMALYELGRLKVGLYHSASDTQHKKANLGDARVTLSKFLELYPTSFCTEQLQQILNALPDN